MKRVLQTSLLPSDRCLVWRNRWDERKDLPEKHGKERRRTGGGGWGEWEMRLGFFEEDLSSSLCVCLPFQDDKWLELTNSQGKCWASRWWWISRWLDLPSSTGYLSTTTTTTTIPTPRCRYVSISLRKNPTDRIFNLKISSFLFFPFFFVFFFFFFIRFPPGSFLPVWEWGNFRRLCPTLLFPFDGRRWRKEIRERELESKLCICRLKSSYVLAFHCALVCCRRCIALHLASSSSPLLPLVM